MDLCQECQGTRRVWTGTRRGRDWCDGCDGTGWVHGGGWIDLPEDEEMNSKTGCSFDAVGLRAVPIASVRRVLYEGVARLDNEPAREAIRWAVRQLEAEASE